MTSSDTLNFFLIIGFMVLVICAVFTTYYFVQALRAIQNLAEDLRDTSQSIKEKIQMRALTLVPSIIAALIGRIFKKRG